MYVIWNELQILVKNSVIVSSVDQVDANGRAGKDQHFIIHSPYYDIHCIYYSLLAN